MRIKTFHPLLLQQGCFRGLFARMNVKVGLPTDKLMRGGSAVAGFFSWLVPTRAVRPFGPWNPTRSQSFCSKETQLSKLELLAGKRHLFVTLTTQVLCLTYHLERAQDTSQILPRCRYCRWALSAER